MDILQKHEAFQAISEAQSHALHGKVEAAIKAFERAFSLAPQDLDTLTVVADGFSELGERDKAIEVLQAALASQEPTEAILSIIGRMAQRMDMPEIAVKIFQTAISLNPNSAAHYVNLANSYRQQQKFDEAIELVRGVLPIMPESGPLWNVLGTVLLEGKKDYKNAETFYREALRQDPKNDQVLLNLANLHGHTETGRHFYEQAIAVNPKNHEAHVGLAIYLLQQGELESGWKHYEHRRMFDSGFASAVACTNQLPLWAGESLKRKSLLVMPEQGIGDEILFSANFPRLLDEAKDVILGCDPRLEEIYKRSFPGATIAPFKDQRRQGRRYRSFPTIEDENGHCDIATHAVWAGSVPKYFWQVRNKIPQISGGHLKPSPSKTRGFGNQIQASGAGPKIGISWRSGNVSFGRDSGYIGLRGAQLILRWADFPAQFFCLQYGWTDDEIDFLRRTNVTRHLHTFDTVDLKNDLDANLAIMANLDAVIGPPIATQQLAMASGAPTYIIAGGSPWWAFGQTRNGETPLSRNCSLFIRSKDNYEEPIREVLQLVEKLDLGSGLNCTST